MSQSINIIGLSIAMLIGCYIAGLIPLCISFSEDRLKKFSIFGAGLLLGTSLAVIIPEGVHVMYSNQLVHAVHPSTSHVDNAKSDLVHHNEQSQHNHHDSVTLETHTLIGLSLVLGFVFMLFIDEIGGKHSHASSSNVEADQGSLLRLRHKSTLTTGLVVHAAADGIALGASATMKNVNLEIIVFVAIMLHKAPAALGLVSLLMREGMDRSRIRRHLAVFSSAAPLLSLFTYFSLNQGGKELFQRMNGTGLALLFSAGTFLYVSTVHVLSDLMNQKTISREGPVLMREHAGFTKTELLLLVMGTSAPVLLSMGHHH